MKGYLKHLTSNLKNGNYTLGILLGITILILMFTLLGSLIKGSIFMGELSIVLLLINAGICISWHNYWYDKNYK